MRLVIADTSPVNYLVLIGHADLLPRLFERVAVPLAVKFELSNSMAPLEVRHWVAEPPAWLEIHDTAGFPWCLAWMKERAPRSRLPSCLVRTCC